jgi:hypothetical protein
LEFDMSDRTCIVPNCPKRWRARGLCNAHYLAFRKNGCIPDVEPTECYPRGWGATDDFEYAADRIAVMASGCWHWTGPIFPNGYGYARRPDITEMAHRFVYRLHCGEIESGLVLDHLCRNPICVNPDHLEPVTQRVNVVDRGHSPTAEVSRTGICMKGHRIAEGNLYISPGGARRCRECLQVNRAERWQRDKAARAL